VRSSALPRVLIPTTHGALMGSVNLRVNDMTIRPQFTPWMGQLLVSEDQRCLGIGTALIDAAASYVERLGYRQLFLFTSGTLRRYYRNRAWINVENVTYFDMVRTLKSMNRDRLRSPQIGWSEIFLLRPSAPCARDRRE
jgi:GNAT superfamily N-acetyltransferase